MSVSIRKCDSCGALHPKVLSYIDAGNRCFYFCNLLCKKNFFDVVYPALLKEEREHEESERSVLPEVRVLIAHKDKKGRVTIVRRDSEICGRPDTGQD